VSTILFVIHIVNVLCSRLGQPTRQLVDSFQICLSSCDVQIIFTILLFFWSRFTILYQNKIKLSLPIK